MSTEQEWIYRDLLDRASDWFADIATEMGCDAGNPDGGSSQDCEHCRMLGFINEIDAALEGNHDAKE